MSVLLEGALDEELDEELGYSKYDYRNKETDNSRNVHFRKTMHTSYGDMDVAGLGMYVGGNESAKFWLSIMNGLKNRGVEGKTVFSSDDSLKKMQIWAESEKSALPICNYSQILYQFL